MLYYSGLLWIYAEFRLRGRLPILMYHRVLPAGADTYSHEGIIVSPDTFAMQMNFLRRHFQPLTPQQFVERLANRNFRRRDCLVTFDDGWRDNFRYAFPVLEQYAIPAIFFVTTGYIGTSSTFWQERMTRFLFLASRSTTFGEDVLRELNALDVRSMTDVKAKRRIRSIVTLLKGREPVVVGQLLERLKTDAILSGIDTSNLGEDVFLDWDDIRELQRSGLATIGSHAHSHVPLPSLGYSAAKSELMESVRTMGDHGIRKTMICAYPNGNVDDSVARAASDAGFRLGFTTRRDRACPVDDPLMLPRINVSELSSASRADFLCLILGVL
jgi:peptidoglycan/xylan/chitin deacetylase (PgdA/CDA1 family)